MGEGIATQIWIGYNLKYGLHENFQEMKSERYDNGIR